jgi:dCTP deaminase
MSFWSSEKIKESAVKSTLIEPYNEKAVEHGAYELGLGPEAFLTSNDENKKTVLAEGEQLVIPPGQFCLLLTEEKVFIPNNALGLISIKAGVKFRGLINVSGFHVDSGFQGRLKFSVYNAGSQNIVLQRKQRVFLLWFCDLDRVTSDTYKGTHINQSDISTEDVMRMQGEIASPGQLRKEIQEVQTNVRVLNWTLTILGSLVLGFIFLFLRGNIQPTSSASQPAQTAIQATNTIATNPVPQLTK